MKTIIAGSREAGAELIDVVMAVLKCGWRVTEVVSGTAPGVDKLGEEYAKLLNLPIHRFPADWAKYGKRAGRVRNAQMADNAEALIAVWDGKSSGTENMIDMAKTRSLKVYIHYLNQKTGGKL